jgi:hypothetical protein
VVSGRTRLVARTGETMSHENAFAKHFAIFANQGASSHQSKLSETLRL